MPSAFIPRHLPVLALGSLGWCLLASFAGAAGVHPPEGTDKTLTLAEDTELVIQPADFGFTDPLDDPADPFLTVSLSLPDKGSLRLDGDPFSAPGIVPVTPVPGWVWRRGPPALTSMTGLDGWVAISPDGGGLIFASSYGNIHTSIDGGTTWTAGTVTRDWSCISFSGDGQTVIAGNDDFRERTGGIFISRDGGLTWQERRPAISTDTPHWTGVASSMDGQKLIASGDGVFIHLSSNAGASWTSVNMGGDPSGVASSADGVRLAYAGGSFILTSTDSGARWNIARQEQRGWKCISSSDDGLRLVAGAYDGTLARSTDGGQTWILTNVGEPVWSTSSSPDGRLLLAAGRGVWMSTDYGVNWAKRKSGGFWRSVAVARNSNRLAAVKAENGNGSAATTTLGVYTSRPEIPSLVYAPPPNGTGDPCATLTFQVGDGGTPPLDITPNTLTFRVTNSNDPPVAAVPLPDHNAPAGKLFSWQIPANAFTDPDPGDVLSFTATQSDGSPLPAWLTFSAAEHTFSGTPSMADRTVLQIRVTATDQAGRQAPDDFLISVAGLPRGADREITLLEDTPYTFTPADFGFTDSDDIPPDLFARIILLSLPSDELEMDGVHLFGTPQYVSVLPEPGSVWTKTGSGRRLGLRCSSDGTILIGKSNGWALDVSRDGGLTWQVRATSDTSGWTALALSGDGKVMCAAEPTRLRVMVSTDTGDTWTARTGVRGDSALAVSADGTHIFAAARGQPLQRSQDSGATWQTLGSGSWPWSALTCSADGSTVLALADNGKTAVSSNAGATWDITDSSVMWNSCACSADGSKLVAGATGGYIYVSSNRGQFWSQRGDALPSYFVTCSSDGRRLAAVAPVSGGGWRVHVSTDGGLSWIPRSIPYEATGLAATADGLRLFTSGQDPWLSTEHIYTSVAAPSQLVFKPGLNRNGSPLTSFTFRVQDNGTSGANTDPVPRTITLKVLPVNDAPERGTLLPLVRMDAATATSYTVPPDAFTDVDTGTVFTYSARMASGAALPAWLSFDPAQRKLSGTPFSSNAGFHDLIITATDNGTPPLSVSTPLMLEVVVYDHPPSASNLNVTIPEDVPRLFQASAFQFTDAEFDDLSGVKITALPLMGVLTIDGVPAVTGAFVRLNPGTVGETWTSINATSRTWQGLASSTDGIRLAGVAYGDGVYTSTDGGQTWVLKLSGGSYLGVASSADGMTLGVVRESGFIMVSTDGGNHWSSLAFPSYGAGIAVSANGRCIAAVSNDGAMRISQDAGATWKSRDEDRAWKSIACSADGSRLVAAARNSPLMISTDGGETWSPRDIARYWEKVCSSADGSQLAAVVANGLIFISTDYGAIWRPRESVRNWSDVDCSANGRLIAATVDGGQIYTSADGGIRWTAAETSRRWNAVSVVRDGSAMLAAVYQGGLFKSVRPPAQALHYVPPPNWSGAVSWSFQAQDYGQAGRNMDLTPNTVQVTVLAVNDPPTLDPIPDWPLMSSADGEKTVSLSGISAGGGESQTLTVTAVSSHPNKIPAPFITYTSPSATGELRFNPVPGAARTVTITVRVQDSGGVAFLRTFKVPLITPFQRWAQENGLPADPAAAGGGNLLRFAFGLPPGSPALGQLQFTGDLVTAPGGPVVAVEENGTLRLYFARRRNSLLTVTPQFSSGLSTWEAATETPAVVAGDEIIEVLRMDFPATLTDDRAPRFARLAVADTP